MDTDLEALATALYVTVDDLLIAHPHLAPPRPRVGLAPRTSDAEIIALAVIQALLGYTSERRFLALCPQAPCSPASRASPGSTTACAPLPTTMSWLITALGRSTSTFQDNLWLADSTPIECARSRPIVKRSELAGWAGYGYCASHSRFFRGLRLSCFSVRVRFWVWDQATSVRS